MKCQRLQKYKQNVIFHPINTFLDVTKVWHQIASLNDIACKNPKIFQDGAPGPPLLLDQRATRTSLTALRPQLSDFFPVLISEKTVLEVRCHKTICK